MTTKVTVDAHAGWPVKVVSQQLGQDGLPSGEPREEIVPPRTTKDFYVHSHLEITSVKEMPNS